MRSCVAFARTCERLRCLVCAVLRIAVFASAFPFSSKCAMLQSVPNFDLGLECRVDTRPKEWRK